MRRLKRCATLLGVATMGLGNVSHGKTLFFEDFEGDLSAWVGKSEGTRHAEIVDDPLEKDHALTFTLLNSAGDIFSAVVNNPSESGIGEYILSFDYLGLRKEGSTDDDFGGFIGYSDGTPGNHVWIAGTQINYGGLLAHLPDTGQWERITIRFLAGTSIRVMLEDFSGSRGVTGDVLFDNILLTDAEGPTTTEENPCTEPEQATISQNLKIHLPEAIYQAPSGDMKLWVDFKYVPNQEGRLLFEVTDYGQVE